MVIIRKYRLYSSVHRRDAKNAEVEKMRSWEDGGEISTTHLPILPNSFSLCPLCLFFLICVICVLFLVAALPCCGEMPLLIYMQIVTHCQLFYVNLCL